MALTEIECKNANTSKKTRKLFDGKGLYLEITPTGGKYWRYKYRVANKEKRLAIGVYPEINLKEARQKHDDARKKLRDGVDPSAEKKAIKQQIRFGNEKNFKAVALQWMEKQKSRWTEKHWKATMTRLETNLFPTLGSRPINEIKALELLDVAKKIEERGAIDLAHKAIQTAGQIFQYAVIYELVPYNIAIRLTRELQPQKKQPNPYLQEHELPAFLKALDNYIGDKQSIIATKLLLLTFLRTTELRAAKWEELNFSKSELRIPAWRMKMREEHIVPLSKQAVTLFKQMHELNGDVEYIFPNRVNAKKYMSENTILGVIKGIGYQGKTTGHGFRATASTILHEHDFASDVIERQLAHAKRNKIRAAYDHSKYLSQRRKMMQWWADYLDGVVSANNS